MSGTSAGVPDPRAQVFVISVAAQLSGLHPQTLRTYERMGLITPGRTGGGGRRYSFRDVERLREISDLTSAGIGIEGVRRILDLDNTVAALRSRNAELADELAATRAALQQALAAVAAAEAAARAAGVAVPAPDRLPALRRPDPTQAIVVWRRGR